MHPNRPLTVMTLALAGLSATAPVRADPATAPKTGFSASGTVTLGQTVRDSARSPELLSRLNARAIGTSGTAGGGRNQDDGNLNFDRGDPVSTVLKAFVEARYDAAPYAWVVSGKAWYDYTLKDQDLPWGNIVNGLRSDRPLSDAGFDRRSRFSGVALQEAYLQIDQPLERAGVRWRVGQQSIGWGNPTLLGGGVRQVDAIDVPSSRRPGNLAGENGAPAWALRGTLTAMAGLRLDGFAQLSFEPHASVVCGTFFSVADYLDGGCDKGVLGATANDRDLLATGSYMRRSDVVRPSGRGQFGLALGYGDADKRLSGNLYAANIHNRSVSYNMVKTRRTSGAPVIAGDPGGLNAQFEMEYAKNLHLYGIDARLQALGGTWTAELTHTPNQPVPLNAGDLVGAFASPVTTAALLRADERATPYGGRFLGYDRLKVSDARLGWSMHWPQLAGASNVRLRVELAGKFVHNLPDVALRRYRRPDVYGNGPVAGVCTGAADSKQCSSDGFVTASAYGARLNLSGSYSLGQALKLDPSLSFGQDFKGWSYDNALGEGRRTVAFALRLSADRAFAELSINHVWGNPYDNAADRDALALSLGTRF